MINNSGHLLLTIINDILDYSKIEAGQLKLSLFPQNIVDAVETAILLCYDMATSKGLSISWYIDPSLPASLLIDATRLQQILLNLLSNAIKFTKSAGSISLTVTGKPVLASGTSPDIDSTRSIGSPSHSTLGSTSSSTPPMPRSAAHRRAPSGYASTSTPTVANSVSSPTLPTSVVTTPTAANSSNNSSKTKYRLEFSVRDSGIGISSAQLKLLFRSFAQVAHSSGQEYGQQKSKQFQQKMEMLKFDCCCRSALTISVIVSILPLIFSLLSSLW